MKLLPSPKLAAALGLLLWITGIGFAALGIVTLRQQAVSAQAVPSYNVTWQVRRMAVCLGFGAAGSPLVLGPTVWRVSGTAGGTSILEKWALSDHLLVIYGATLEICNLDFNYPAASAWSVGPAFEGWGYEGPYTAVRYTGGDGAQRGHITLVLRGWQVTGCARPITNPCTDADVGGF